MSKVPSGTKGPCGRPPLADGHPFFCRPARDFYLCWTLNPAMNGWAIVIASLRDRPQVWFCSARPSSGLRPPSPAPAGEGHVGGEGESSAVLLKTPRRDWPDHPPPNRNRPPVISSPRGED